MVVVLPGTLSKVSHEEPSLDREFADTQNEAPVFIPAGAAWFWGDEADFLSELCVHQDSHGRVMWIPGVKGLAEVPERVREADRLKPGVHEDCIQAFRHLSKCMDVLWQKLIVGVEERDPSTVDRVQSALARLSRTLALYVDGQGDLPGELGLSPDGVQGPLEHPVTDAGRMHWDGDRNVT